MDIVPMIERSAEGRLAVSSLTVAEGSDVEHRAVLQLVDNNIDDLEDFGTLAFEMRKSGGRPTRIAVLNEPQATLIMTYQRNTEKVRHFKKALVKAFYEMAQRIAVPALPQSYGEALRELASAVEAREALTAKVAADAPKVEYIDQFVASGDLLKLRHVASNLGVQESVLRDLLIRKNWIYAEHTDRWSEKRDCKVTQTRYSAYADKKPYFQPVMVHDAPRFRGEVMHTLKVTPAGAAAIRRLHENAQKDLVA